MGDRFATLFQFFQNFPSASYLDRQCMDSGSMSQCYINITYLNEDVIVAVEIAP